ncbi:hypothetical protein Pint_28679 [Pistacia integerrima]|uniref:Uncharacterized protein n=1 Tax=Pistacia integerrima TaxID=434235 RepID=A0ACC0YQM2_9ROSI|nr:hypothetical protein Pint_28679 [Pistacia integerrima]
MSASCGSSDGWKWFKDPRLDCVGCRGIFPSGITFANPSFFLSVAAPLMEADKERGEENYVLWRLEKGVAEGSTEIPKEAMPLEYNLSGLNAISFEVEQKVAPGSEFINVETGKKAGKVTATLGCCGLGVLRLEEAFKVSGFVDCLENSEKVGRLAFHQALVNNPRCFCDLGFCFCPVKWKMRGRC